MSSELVLVSTLDSYIVLPGCLCSRAAYWWIWLFRFAYFDTPPERGLPRPRVRKTVSLPVPLLNATIRIARSQKADALRKAYSKYGDKVDIVVVDDLVKGDFTEVLKGVSAVIHTATPVPGREKTKDVLEVSCPSVDHLSSSLRLRFQITREGALNIVRQAVAAGVRHISFAGSAGTLLSSTDNVIKAPLTDRDWNPLSEEEDDLDSDDAVLVLTVAKTRAERALWKFAEVHPELNFTTSMFRVFLFGCWYRS